MGVHLAGKSLRGIFSAVPVATGCIIASMVLQKYDEDLDDSSRLWRYMSFDQFVHMLASKRLWLAPLSSMEDKREGKWIELQSSNFGQDFREQYDYAAKQTVISSWAAAADESLPLWNSHAPADTGIAISTDVYSLIRALSGKRIVDDFFYIMKVEYLSHPKVISLNPPIYYTPVLSAKYKSNDFQYENEVRIVYARSSLQAVTTPGVPIPAELGKGTHIPIKKIADAPTTPRAEIWLMKRTEPGEGTHTCIPILPDGVQGVIDYSIVPPASGTYIKIKSIYALVKNGIFVSPRAKPWMFETVKSVLRAYGHDPSLVRKSALTHLFETPISPPFQHNITYE